MKNKPEFVADEDVKLSHSPPGYPKSITVQPINTNAEVTEIDPEDYLPKYLVFLPSAG